MSYRTITPETARVAVIARPLAAEILSSWLNWSVARANVAQLAMPEGLEAIEKEFDLVLLGDLFNMPDDRCSALLGALSAVQRCVSDVPVVVVTDGEDYEVGRRCLQAGARGYIPARASIAVAISALRLVLNGGVYVPLEVVAQTGSNRPGGHVEAALPGPEASPHAGIINQAALSQLSLSRREGEIFCLLQNGAGNRQIASSLGISDNTVMVHMRNLMRKLGATNRAQAVFKARQKLAELTLAARNEPRNELVQGRGSEAPL